MGGQRHALAALPQGKGPVTHFIGGWVGPRAGLELTHEINQYLYLSFQASAAKYTVTALFLLIFQRAVVTPYRRFGTSVPKIIILIRSKPLLTERIRYVPTGLTPSLHMFQSVAPQLFPHPHLGNSLTGGGVLLLRGIPMFPGPASWIIDCHYAEHYATKLSKRAALTPTSRARACVYVWVCACANSVLATTWWVNWSMKLGRIPYNVWIQCWPR